MKRRLTLLAAGTLALSACGGGAGAGTGTGANDTIKILQVAPYESQTTSLPFMKTAAQAAVEEINAAGGVKGRKLELLTCNEKQDPNEALKCAQKAAREKATAVVGSLTTFGAQVMPVLEQ